MITRAPLETTTRSFRSVGYKQSHLISQFIGIGLPLVCYWRFKPSQGCLWYTTEQSWYNLQPVLTFLQRTGQWAWGRGNLITRVLSQDNMSECTPELPQNCPKYFSATMTTSRFHFGWIWVEPIQVYEPWQSESVVYLIP